MTIDTILEISRFPVGGALILANIAVWYGVYLERDDAPKEVQQKGWKILLVGLAAETAIGLPLFAIDTTIGYRQRIEIAAAEQRAANAELEAGHLGVDVKNLHGFVAGEERKIKEQFAGFQLFAAEEKKQNEAVISEFKKEKDDLLKARTDAIAAAAVAKTLAVANAPRVLSPESINRLTDSLKPYSGTNFDTTVTIDAEATALLDQIVMALEKSGWLWKAPIEPSGMVWRHSGKPDTNSMMFRGLAIELPEANRAAFEKQATALVNALKAAGLAVTVFSTVPADVNPKGNDRIHVMVGAR